MPSTALAEFSCGVCKEEFSYNSQDDRAPINGACSHKVCRDCVQKMQVAAITENCCRHHVVNIKCPICKREKSFRADNLIVDVEFCRALRCIEALSSSSNQDNDHGDNSNIADDDICVSGVANVAEDVKVKAKPDTDKMEMEPGDAGIGTGMLSFNRKKEENAKCDEEQSKEGYQNIPNDDEDIVDCEGEGEPPSHSEEVVESSSSSRRSSRRCMQTNYCGLEVRYRSADDKQRNESSLPLSLSHDDDRASTSTKSNKSSEDDSEPDMDDMRAEPSSSTTTKSVMSPKHLQEQDNEGLLINYQVEHNADARTLNSDVVGVEATVNVITSRRSSRNRIPTNRYIPEDENENNNVESGEDESKIAEEEKTNLNRKILVVGAREARKSRCWPRIEINRFNPDANSKSRKRSRRGIFNGSENGHLASNRTNPFESESANVSASSYFAANDNDNAVSELQSCVEIGRTKQKQKQKQRHPGTRGQGRHIVSTTSTSTPNAGKLKRPRYEEVIELSSDSESEESSGSNSGSTQYESKELSVSSESDSEYRFKPDPEIADSFYSGGERNKEGSQLSGSLKKQKSDQSHRESPMLGAAPGAGTPVRVTDKYNNTEPESGHDSDSQQSEYEYESEPEPEENGVFGRLNLKPIIPTHRDSARLAMDKKIELLDNESMPRSMDDIIRLMDKLEPTKKYFDRQKTLDSDGKWSSIWTRQKLRALAAKDPTHPAIRYWVERRKVGHSNHSIWKPPSKDTLNEMVVLLKNVFSRLPE